MSRVADVVFIQLLSLISIDFVSKMVLEQLGSKLQSALATLNTTTIVDDDVLNNILKDICAALLESDVQVQLVRQIRDNVRLTVAAHESAAGVNRRRLIQKAVLDQLIQILQSKKKPFKLKKGGCNTVMFVGLQVRDNLME